MITSVEKLSGPTAPDEVDYVAHGTVTAQLVSRGGGTEAATLTLSF